MRNIKPKTLWDKEFRRFVLCPMAIVPAVDTLLPPSTSGQVEAVDKVANEAVKERKTHRKKDRKMVK